MSDISRLKNMKYVKQAHKKLNARIIILERGLNAWRVEQSVFPSGKKCMIL